MTIGLSGIFAWLLAGPLPLVTHTDGELAGSWAVALPLLALGAGLTLVGRHSRGAEVMLLGAFPPCLVVASYLMQPANLEAGLSGYAVAVAALALVLYLVGTLRTLDRGTQLTAAVSVPLDGDGAARSEPRRRIAGSVWVAISALGAFVVFGVAPYLVSQEQLAESFGGDAPEARLLMTAVGTCLGLGSLAFTVAPSLRARRSRETRPSRRLLRYAIYPMALAVTVALWWFTRL